MIRKTTALVLAALAIFSLVSFTQVSRADDAAERLRIAADYVEISKQSMQVDKVVDVALNQIADTFRGQLPDFDIEKERRMRELARPIFMEQMDRIFIGLDKPIADIFTLEELKAMVAFMGSDVGKSIMHKMPLYMSKVQPAIMNGMQARMPDIVAMLQESGVIPTK